MRTIVKLLIIALFVNASAQVGYAAWRYYIFKDSVVQVARLEPKLSDRDLHKRILELAEEQQIPLSDQDLAVQRVGGETTISAAFYEPIELVPRFYTREHLFHFEVTVRPRRPVTVDDLK